jgi:GT2 family glycosyltransferase
VTAVIVGHDGAGWLSHGLDALQAQTKPVQRVVAVDTGSRDRSGAVLTGKLGQAAVFGMDRATGYAAAVRRALQHKSASAPLPVPAGSAATRGRPEQVEWLWLLHDDCEPAPDALEQLLRGAAETPAAAVLGPKLMDWTDRDVVLETGISLDTVGRRITGIEPREVDQGQHDGDRDVLAVSSAGMLIRREVWDQVGGFDPGMALFGEDIDLCWRVHAAGFRVRVITDAVVYHALAATRGRRPISVGRRARLLDRRNGLLTLLGNLPAGPMLLSLVANLAISLVRTIFYTVAKRGTAALDEAAAVAGVLGQPLKFAAARRRRARGRRAAYSRVRADLQAGHSLRRAAEFVALVLTRSGKPETSSGLSAIDDPTDDDSLLTDSGFLQRFITRPAVLLLAALVVVTAVAEHALLGGGPLGGGALLPAWEGASTLWGEVLQAFHPVGVGSASAAPPSAGFVALLATLLLGKTWLAVDVLLLGCVPLAGLTALLALRKVTKSALVRVWAAASYALLPVVFGAVSAGRLGSAVAFVLIPVIGLAAGRMFTESPRLARRAAWAVALIVTVGTAFVPVLWPMTVVAAVAAAVVLRRSSAMLINLLIIAVTPVVLLLPWMLQLLAHPSALLLEAGVQQPGLATPNLPARAVLLLSPGGPGLPPYWASAALVLVALVALAAPRRRVLIVSGWCVGLLGLAVAVAMSRTAVTPAGGAAMTPWPGPALAVAAAGLLLASAAGAESLGRALAGRGRKGLRALTGPRGLAAALLGLVAFSAPVLAAVYWLGHPVAGPVAPVSGEVLPALAPISGDPGWQLRTLVLSRTDGHVSYLLLRGGSPQFADPGLVPVTAAQTALSHAVAALVAPSGGLAADQSEQLARFDVGFVLVRAPASPQLVSTLNTVAGLTLVSRNGSFDLWRLTTLPARVTVVEPSGAVVPVSSGPIGVSGATAPTTGGILELAEPAGGWHAALNGRGLTPVRSPAGSWAEAFRLPAGGGTLTVGRNGLLHDLVTGLELFAILVVAVLALPGVRTAAEIEAAAAASTQTAREAKSEDEAADDGLAEPAGAPAAGAGRGRPPARPGRGRGGTTRKAGRGARGRPATTAAEDAGAPATAGRGTGRSRRAAGSRAAPARVAQGEPGQPGTGERAGRRRARPPAAGTRPGRKESTAADVAAAGAAAAGVAAAGLAGAAAGRAAAGGPPRAAWPAGQPASRFLSEPPEPRQSRPDGDPAAWPLDDRPSVPWDSDARPRRPAARAGLSPSGSGFDDLSAGPEPVLPSARGELPVRDELSGRGGLPTGQGDRYRDDGASGRPPRHRGRGDDPGYQDPAADRDITARPSYPARPAAGPTPPGSSYPEEPAYPDYPAPRSGRGRDDRTRDWGPPAPEPGSGWRTAENSSWDREDDYGSAWPEAGQPGSRTQHQQQGWPDEYAGGSTGPDGWGVPGQAAWPGGDSAGPADWSGDGTTRAGDWPQAGQSAWAGPSDELEALPQAGDVQPDWPSRSERRHRGWIPPDEDADGESW